MNGIGSIIKSKGYWTVAIRPTTFEANRVKRLSDLFPLVSRLAVQIRGWDFPHIDTQQRPIIAQDWVGQEFQWLHYVEAWRLYQSGQFAYQGGMITDWIPDSEKGKYGPPIPKGHNVLGLDDAAYRFAEVFEFASRLALSEAGDEGLHIRVGAHGLQGRTLYVDNPRGGPFSQVYTARIPEYPQEGEFARSDLAADTRRHAVEWLVQLLERFGWNPPLDLIRQKVYRPG